MPPRPQPQTKQFEGWHRSAAHACHERVYETHLSHLYPPHDALIIAATLADLNLDVPVTDERRDRGGRERPAPLA